MRILVSYRGTERPGWATGDSLCRAFRQLGHDVFPYGNYYRTESRMDSGIPDVDLLVFLECCDGDPQYTELAGLNCPRVYWEFDTALHKDFTRQLIDYMNFDLVFMANYECATEFGARYMPYAIDASLFSPDEHTEGHGAAIVGSPFGPRQEFADAAGLDIISGAFGADYVDAIRGLAVHVHYMDSGGKGMVVARPFETMACGVCLLAEDTPAMRRHWVPGTHFEAFTGPGDCMDKACKLLEDDRRRKRIAAAGLTSVMSRHQYLNRARTILAAI